MIHHAKKNRYWLAFILLWTVLVFALVIEENSFNEQFINEMAIIESKTNFDKDLIYREWVASHGGVYVPVTEKTPPNPYLENIQERDIETPSGRKLTLVNPAYMTRQVHEMSANGYGVKGHITSLRPLRPENGPDEWERQALEEFETGAEFARVVTIIEGETYLREMHPLYLEKNCLHCHAQQGYSPGAIRGGISVSVPLKHYIEFHAEYVQKNYLTHLVIWIIGCVSILYIRKKNIDQAKEVENSLKNTLLSEASLKAKSIALEKTQDLGQIGTWELNYPESMFYWSDQNCHIFGVPSGTVPSVEKFREKVHPEDRVLVAKAWQDALNKKPYDLEYRLVVDGQEKWVRGKANFKFDNNGNIELVSGFTQDITRIKSIEIELQINKKRFKDIVLSMGDWIWEINLDGVYVFSSEKSIDVIGYSPEEVIGKVCFDFITPKDQIKTKNFFAKIVKEKSSFRNYENWNLKKSGERVCLLSSATPTYSADGEISGFLGIDTDITEQKRLQAQAIRTAQLASLGELAAGVAHEINNPIGGVINYADILKKRITTEKELDILDRIINEGERIAEIVRKLLLFARDEGQELKQHDIHTILDEPLSLMSAQLMHDNIETSVSIDETLGYVRCNAHQIEQILLNLLSNSRHALNKKILLVNAKKVISIVAKRIKREDKYFLLLEVRDNGVGIPADVLPSVLNPFYTTKESGSGTGLGLSISAEIIQGHDGTIAIDSVVGEYTKVIIEIPLDS